LSRGPSALPFSRSARSLGGRLALPLIALGLAIGVSTAQELRSSTPAPEDSLRAVQAAAARALDHRELAVLLGASTRPPLVVNPDPPDYRVGRVDSFWLGRPNPPSHVQRAAVLRHVGRHAYWYVQEGLPFDEAALRSAADAFDNQIYPEVRRLVGSEPFPGIDNDPRVTIFNGDVPGLAGYVSSTDSYPASSREFSNEREIIYLNSQVDPVGSPEYLSTLTHEFTHLVHWNVQSAEDTWVKEGLGTLIPSMVLAGRELGSSSFASVPDVMLTSWTGDGHDTSPASAHYQASAWFLRYLVDRYGAPTLSCLLQNGRGLARDVPLARCGHPHAEFVDLFNDWVVANVVGKRSGQGIKPYATQGPDASQARRVDVPSILDETVPQFGTRYYELPAGSPVALEFAGAPTVPVVKAAPSVGGPIWYSGRSDGSVASMSRSFDLSGIGEATLAYDLWVDTEEHYDFAYVLVSRDDGKSWQLLEATGMSRANPAGHNLGVGYTGRINLGAGQEWLQETVDLTPYTGGRVSVAFWYVTDDAVSGEGVAVKNVRLDAVGYRDEGDPGPAGWSTQGWSRVGPQLPQLWAVQAIEFAGDSVRASRVPIDGSGRGTWETGGADRVILAVSGVTPVTLERGSYRLEVRRR